MFFKSITMTGFKGYKESKTFNFDERITGIIGDNGKGKTSIADSIRWLLTGADKNGNERNHALMLNKESQEMSVEAVIEYEGKSFTMERTFDRENTMLLIDGKKAASKSTDKLIGSKQYLMALLDMEYLLRMEPKSAREFFIGLLPPVTTEEIKAQMANAADLPPEELSNTDKLLSTLREKLKKLDQNEQNLTGRIAAHKSSIKQVPEAMGFDKEKENEIISLEKKFKGVETSLKKEKELTNELNSLLRQRDSKASEKDTLLKDYNRLKNEIAEMNANKCPTCGQNIHNKDQLKAPKVAEQSEIQGKGKALKADIESLDAKIAALQADIEKIKSLTNATDIVDKLTALKNEKHKVEVQNSSRDIILKDNERFTSEIEQYEKSIDQLVVEKATTEKQIAAVKEYILKATEIQMNKLSAYLEKVSIKLFKTNNSTGEITDTYEIMYDGKESRLLSYSEKIKVGIEMANAINAITGLQLPMFIDNAESVTKFQLPKDSQVIVAKVMQGTEVQIFSKPAKNAA